MPLPSCFFFPHHFPYRKLQPHLCRPGSPNGFGRQLDLGQSFLNFVISPLFLVANLNQYFSKFLSSKFKTQRSVLSSTSVDYCFSSFLVEIFISRLDLGPFSAFYSFHRRFLRSFTRPWFSRLPSLKVVVETEVLLVLPLMLKNDSRDAAKKIIMYLFFTLLVLVLVFLAQLGFLGCGLFSFTLSNFVSYCGWVIPISIFSYSKVEFRNYFGCNSFDHFIANG